MKCVTSDLNAEKATSTIINITDVEESNLDFDHLLKPDELVMTVYKTHICAHSFSKNANPAE